ncbi:hypothetical protein G7059_08360 [Erysipelothrix sp. HDW6A]|uniref:(4Fe-4S)-binding protein n=1 Tax=Erysipelothrix sp. HDW6A TaxID=2714928 RepID=UPI00140E01C9|nr:(4Fe-4S)-binding protein [Erysipelothrix sp. HDW6A]QIK57847.1 hypothetical protein G7059_08360 [Erysipelothrix sp. HDW6A]
MTEKELLEKGYRKYVGTKVDVYFNKDICQHSGICVKGLSEVFDLNRKPWIIPDNATEEALINLIDSCPSGALQYIVKNEN